MPRRARALTSRRVTSHEEGKHALYIQPSSRVRLPPCSLSPVPIFLPSACDAPPPSFQRCLCPLASLPSPLPLPTRLRVRATRRSLAQSSGVSSIVKKFFFSTSPLLLQGSASRSCSLCVALLVAASANSAHEQSVRRKRSSRLSLLYAVQRQNWRPSGRALALS